MEGIELPSREQIWTLGEKETYKYLGKLNVKKKTAQSAVAVTVECTHFTSTEG